MIKLYCGVLISVFIFSCICDCVDYKLYRVYICSRAVGFYTVFVTSIGFKGVFCKVQWVLAGSKCIVLFLIKLCVLQ